MRKVFIILSLLTAAAILSSTELRVSTVIIEGNRLISDGEVISIIRTKVNTVYNQKTAIDDCQTIAEYYGEKGFVNVRVLYPEAVPISSDEVRVHFYIEEGNIYTITGIEITGNSYISTDRLTQETGFRTGSEYPLDFINTYMTRVIDFYASRGFLFARTELDSIVVSRESLSYDAGNSNEELEEGNEIVPLTVYITIDEGRYCRFENFIFRGNKVTKDNTLMRISGLDRLELFSLDNLQLAEENVRRKEYIRDFSIIPLNYQTILLETEEDRMTHIYGMLGYDSSQPEGQNKLTGFINLKLLNLYGSDRSLSFFWRQLRTDRQSIEFRYFEPGPFNYPVAAELSLYRETADSTYILTTIESDIYYYSLKNKYGIHLGLDNISPGTRRDEIIETVSYNKGGVFWRHNSEDYYLNPTKGIGFYAGQYFITHKEKDGRVNKQATEISWRQYNRVFSSLTQIRPVVFMLSVNGNQIQNKELQDYEQYTLGGINNVRGFREEQFSGYRVIWSNLELRYLLTRRSRFFLFADYGYVQLTDGETVINDLLGVGFGLRLDTRLGLFGVDYGFSHSENRWMHPLDGMVHFGLEARF